MRRTFIEQLGSGRRLAGRSPAELPAPALNERKASFLNKQFMVLKMVVGAIGAAMSVIPLGGLMPFELAEQLRARLAQDEPESVFLIQEVGTA